VKSVSNFIFIAWNIINLKAFKVSIWIGMRHYVKQLFPLLVQIIFFFEKCFIFIPSITVLKRCREDVLMESKVQKLPVNFNPLYYWITLFYLLTRSVFVENFMEKFSQNMIFWIGKFSFLKYHNKKFCSVHVTEVHTNKQKVNNLWIILFLMIVQSNRKLTYKFLRKLRRQNLMLALFCYSTQ
jgi:hypothetical protein